MRSRFNARRLRPRDLEPHGWARFFWYTWAVLSAYAIGSGQYVNEALGLFFVLEFAGVIFDRQTAFGWTFSEIVWYDLPWAPLRWALGIIYGGAFAVYVSPVAGLLLTAWLAPHFVIVRKAFRDYEGRVAQLAVKAYSRDQGVYPSSIDYLQETLDADDPSQLQTLRDAQRLYVALERGEPAVWRKTASTLEELVE